MVMTRYTVSTFRPEKVETDRGYAMRLVVSSVISVPSPAYRMVFA